MRALVWSVSNDSHSVSALTSCELRNADFDEKYEEEAFTVLGCKFDRGPFGVSDIHTQILEFVALKENGTCAQFNFSNVRHNLEVPLDIQLAFLGVWKQLNQIQHRMPIATVITVNSVDSYLLWMWK